MKKIDCFCVGGGGGGYVSRGYSPNGWQIVGAGGGGGYTSTKLGVDVTPGQEIAVTVGAGGNGYYLDNGVGIFNSNPTNGGTSKIDYGGPLAIGGVATSSRFGAKGGSGEVEELQFLMDTKLLVELEVLTVGMVDLANFQEAKAK